MNIETADSQPSPKLRWLGFGVGVYVIQAAVIYGLVPTGDDRRWLALLLPLAHALLLPFLLRNLSFWGIRLVLLGLLINLAAMAANGGLMPVEGSAVEAVGRHEASELQVGSPVPGSKNVLLDREDVRLRELSDIIVLPVPPPLTHAVSLGDFFVFVGVAVTYLEVVRRSSAWNNPRQQ